MFKQNLISKSLDLKLDLKEIDNLSIFIDIGLMIVNMNNKANHTTFSFNILNALFPFA